MKPLTSIYSVKDENPADGLLRNPNIPKEFGVSILQKVYVQDLYNWFDRPFFQEDQEQGLLKVLCFDGRFWNEPTKYAEAPIDTSEEKLAGVLEDAKDDLIRFWITSSLRVERRNVGDWGVWLTFPSPHLRGYFDEELLFVTPSNILAHLRYDLLLNIRMARMRNVDRLFCLNRSQGAKRGAENKDCQRTEMSSMHNA